MTDRLAHRAAPERDDGDTSADISNASFVGTGAPNGFSWENFAGIRKVSSLPHIKLDP